MDAWAAASPLWGGGRGGAVFDFQGKKFHRGRSRALVVDNISSKNAISGLITKTLSRSLAPGGRTLTTEHIVPRGAGPSRLHSPPLSDGRRLLKRVTACPGPTPPRK